MKTISRNKQTSTTRRSAAATVTNTAARSTNRSSQSDRTTVSAESRIGNASASRVSSLVEGLECNYSSPETRLGGHREQVRNARTVYGRHGAEPHNLNDRQEVGRLISRAPQLDDMNGRRRVVMREASPGHRAETSRVNTDGDEMRCGGASVFNSLLMDGNPRANADALRTVANQRARAARGQEGGFQINDTQRRAMQHMREGSLTPREAAVLQEMTYDMSRSGNDPQEGLTTRQIGDTLRDLRRAGGLPNTRAVNVRGQTYGGPVGHATVSTQTNNGGVHFADSWPQENGYATVTGRREASFGPGDHPERNFRTSVTLRGQGDANDRLIYRANAGPRNASEQRTVAEGGNLRPIEQQCTVQGEEGCYTPRRVFGPEMTTEF